MPREDFIRLLTKYRNGQCTEEEIRLIDHWYDQLGEGGALSMSEAERQSLKKNLWQQIDNQVDAEIDNLQEEKIVQLPVFRRWAVAAAVTVLIGVGALLTYRLRSDSVEMVRGKVRFDAGIVERTNTTSQTQKITLTDSSVVLLQPNSSVRYTTNTKGNKRETWLKGKAFFQVKRNPERPFLVYSGTIVTRVLGTSFWVTAPTNASTVEVAVHTGKVAVFKSSQESGVSADAIDEESQIVITPNQKVTIFVQQNRLTRALIDEPRPIQLQAKPESVNFSFDASPLPEVLSRLERLYGIEMVLGNKALADCRFTGDITQQPLYSKLELICQTINAQYEVQGPRIIINGIGCTP